MIPATLEEIARAVGGQFVGGSEGFVIDFVSTDSRRVKKGDLFVALKGASFDGHRFAGEAAGKGAAALLLEYGSNSDCNKGNAGEPNRAASQPNADVDSLPPGIPVILVQDTLKALQRLARQNRLKAGLPLVAVTGSSGKTSTKDIIAAILSVKFKTVKTQGNLNNEIGVPLTLLDIESGHQAAVVEMAMRGPGEIGLLGSVAAPVAAVITNVGEAHIERLGSLENIARAKGEILEHVPPDSFAVLHGDNTLLREQACRCAGRVVYFGELPQNDVRAVNILSRGGGNSFTLISPRGECELFMPLPGRHNILNCLAATSVALEMGLSFKDIQKGLNAATFSAMRLEISRFEGITLINDAYNANPSSTSAALQVLSEMAGPGRKIAVLGDMLELGPHAEAEHRRVGEAALQNRVDILIAVGTLSADIRAGAINAGFNENSAYHFKDHAGALGLLAGVVAEGDYVLVKGSRAMGMEQVARGLTDCIGGYRANR